MGDQPIWRAEGGRERGLDGLVGPVKRSGLSLTHYYSVSGKDMVWAVSNFSEVSPTTV